jgi:hypothetical protein
MDYRLILETQKDSFDIIFVQEPPWKVIRKTVLTKNPHRDDGVPKHPDWLYMI